MISCNLSALKRRLAKMGCVSKKGGGGANTPYAPSLLTPLIMPMPNVLSYILFNLLDTNGIGICELLLHRVIYKCSIAKGSRHIPTINMPYCAYRNCTICILYLFCLYAEEISMIVNNYYLVIMKPPGNVFSVKCIANDFTNQIPKR